MTTLSELITTLKGKMLPLTGGTLSGNLEIGGNATVSGKNIVRSINGTVAGTDGNVTITIPSAYKHPNSGVTAGTYNKVTVNAQGHVTAGSNTTFATVATSGKYSDLSGKPSLATVATTGSYTDLSNKPSIPSSPKAYITSTYHSGSSWYRKWSDGFIEQGGIATMGSSYYAPVSLHTAFSNNYYFIHGIIVEDNANSSVIGVKISISPVKTSSSCGLTATWAGGGSNGYLAKGIKITWYACGY